MIKLITRLALVIALLSFVFCTLKNISITTSLFRAVIVFIGVQFIFFVAANFLKFIIPLFTPSMEAKDEKK